MGRAPVSVNRHDAFCRHGAESGSVENCDGCVADAMGENELDLADVQAARRFLVYRKRLSARVRPLVEKEWCGSAVLKAIEETKW